MSPSKSSEPVFFIITDDDADDHFFIKQACGQSEFNYVAESLYNGKQLLDYLLKRNNYSQIDTPKPAFILLDLNMPLMNGFHVLEEIKKHEDLKDIPAFVLTTSSNQNDQKKAKKLGARGFYTKPWEVDKFRKIIDEACMVSMTANMLLSGKIFL
jgi:CheY-like chemotaxis protein